MARLHRLFLEPLGLTYPQFLVLLCLYESVPRTVGDIGAALGMETGTLTPLGVPARIETACRLSHGDLASLRDTLNGLAHSPPSERDEETD